MKKSKNVQRTAVAALAVTMALGTPGAVLADNNGEQYVLGDLNGDKAVDIKDIALLKRYVAGWDVEFVSYGLDGGSTDKTDETKKDDEAIGERNIPKDAVMFNGHYYHVFGAESWEEANKWCKQNGGHLATITSEEENIFIYENLVYKKNLGIAVFGLTDEETEGVWKWVTGETFKYTNWADGQPNNYGGSQNYGAYYDDGYDYKWEDAENLSGNYICEWEPLEGDAVATTLTIENESGGDFIKDVSQATVTFALNGDSSKVKVSVVDVTDAEVYTRTFDECPADIEYTFKWDGKNTDGNYVSDGVYSVVVKAGTVETTSGTIKFSTQSDFAGGDGSESNPYLVSSLEQLKKVGNNSTRCFKQTANIDANYETLEVMGASDVPFQGYYDGNGCKISNLIISKGLFAVIGNDVSLII